MVRPFFLPIFFSLLFAFHTSASFSSIVERPLIKRHGKLYFFSTGWTSCRSYRRRRELKATSFYLFSFLNSSPSSYQLRFFFFYFFLINYLLVFTEISVRRNPKILFHLYPFSRANIRFFSSFRQGEVTEAHTPKFFPIPVYFWFFFLIFF